MTIELRLWAHARALADHRSFARASRALRMSQPALTRSIQELERRVGVPLFERRRHGVETTDAGQTLLAEASRLLELAQGMEGEIVRLRGAAGGVVAVGLEPYPAELLIGSAVARFHERFPRAQVRIVVGDWAAIVRGVRARELDFGVAEVSEAGRDPDLRIQPLGSHPLRWIVRPGHPVLARPRPTLRDLLAHPVVATARIPPRILPFILRALPGGEDGASRPFPAIQCEPVSLLKDVVRSSNATACVPLSSVAADLRAGTLADSGVDEPWQHTGYGVISLAGRSLAPAAAGLLREVRAVERRITRGATGRSA